jgi:hypothetical protein
MHENYYTPKNALEPRGSIISHCTHNNDIMKDIALKLTQNFAIGVRAILAMTIEFGDIVSTPIIKQ